MKSKSILIFVGGIVTGIVLTILFFIGIAAVSNNDNGVNKDVVWLDKPQQEIKVNKLEVMQVLSDGSALAMVKFDINAEDNDNIGMVVCFPAQDGTAYYDDQVITIPKGKRLMQVGIYKYMTRQEMEKTVPIVEIVD